MQEAWSAMISKTVADSAFMQQSMQDTLAAVADQLEFPVLRVPPELLEITRLSQQALAPAFEAMRQVVSQHESLVSGLSRHAASMLKRDWELLAEAAERPADQWDEQAAGLTLEAAQRYVKILAVIGWILILGMAMSSRHSDIDPTVQKFWDQMAAGTTMVRALARLVVLTDEPDD
jgi:hypothetical protein